MHPALAATLAVLFAIAFCVLLGVLMDRVAYKPLRGRAAHLGADHRHRISLRADHAQLIFGSGQVTFPQMIPKIALFKGQKARVTSWRC